MHFLPRETIEARFNLKGDEGTVIEAAGTISRGMAGMGFIYANKECVSLGIGCLVADFAETGETPYGACSKRFKRHPSVAPLIEGSEVKEYSAHLIPEGGYKAIPQLYGDGWVVVRRRRPTQQRGPSRRLQPRHDVRPHRRRGDLPDQVARATDDGEQSSLYKKMLDRLASS